MGRLATIFYGEIEGLQKGITTDDSFWEISRAFDVDSISSKSPISINSEYLIGYGIGLQKGRVFREGLRKEKDWVDIDDKAQLIVSFYHSYKYKLFGYFDFLRDLELFLDNQDNWENTKIPLDMYQSTIALLQKGLLNRAMKFLAEYFFENFQLEAFIKMEGFLNQLSTIRAQKSRKEITSEEVKQLKIKLETKLTNWLESENGN